MINKVILVGRLGKDPEVSSIPSGAVYARFSVATSESYKEKDGNWKENTEWHNVILWREAAQRAERQLKKGMLVYIEGKLTHRSWQDQEGNTKYITEVQVMTFRALEKIGDRSGSTDHQGGTDSGSNHPPLTEPQEEDGLPF